MYNAKDNTNALPHNGTCIKELVPGITTNAEKASFSKLSSHESQLKNEELFYRVQQR